MAITINDVKTLQVRNAKNGDFDITLPNFPQGDAQEGVVQIQANVIQIRNAKNGDFDLNLATGGGGDNLIDTIPVVNERTKSIDVNLTWFDTYDFVLIVPDIDIAIESDWIYLLIDTTTVGDGAYGDSLTKFDDNYFCILKKATETTFKGVWSHQGMRPNGTSYNFGGSTNLFFYAYRGNDVMNGNFKIYGIKL